MYSEELEWMRKNEAKVMNEKYTKDVKRMRQNVYEIMDGKTE